MLRRCHRRWASRLAFPALKRLCRDCSGSNTLLFALSLPVMLACAGMAIDYAYILRAQHVLQMAADSGAIAGAKELSLADSNRENVAAVVQSVVDNFVKSQTLTTLPHTPTTTAQVLREPLRVEVQVDASITLLLPRSIHGGEVNGLRAKSAAQVMGKPNICVLGLDDSRPGTVDMDNSASVEGQNCSVFSNSTSNAGLKARGNSVMHATFICSAGGAVHANNFFPGPMQDCPTFDDPLADRPEPPVGSCTFTNRVISSGTASLTPGTYCGGLTVSGGATVDVAPGVYVIKDGPFKVGAGASLTGRGVGFFLTGAGAVVAVDAANLALEGPTSGPMAGLLFFEGRSQPQAAHSMLPANAQTMVGTLYFPKGQLHIGGTGALGQTSAYTAIDARIVSFSDGPRVVLNTNYDDTDVPVPEGIKGAGQPVALVK